MPTFSMDPVDGTFKYPQQMPWHMPPAQPLNPLFHTLWRPGTMRRMIIWLLMWGKSSLFGWFVVLVSSLCSLCGSHSFSEPAWLKEKCWPGQTSIGSSCFPIEWPTEVDQLSALQSEFEIFFAKESDGEKNEEINLRWIRNRTVNPILCEFLFE